MTLTLRNDGRWTIRWLEMPPGQGRVFQPLEPERCGRAEDLGPDWREALGAMVADVLVDRCWGA